MRQRTCEIDLGDAPPIVIDAEDAVRRFRRSSVIRRWILGYVTASVTATTLMAGALWAAFDRPSSRLPFVVASPARSPLYTPNAPKTDMLRVEPAAGTVEAHGGAIAVAVVEKERNTKRVETRPYRYTDQSLAASLRIEAPAVPPYDLARIIGSIPQETSTTDEIYGVGLEADFEVTINPFPTNVPVEDFSFTEADDRAHIARPSSDDANIQEAQRTGPGDTGHDGEGAFEELLSTAATVPPNVTILEANITELVKSAAAADRFVDLIQDGDTIEDILVGSGVIPADAEVVRKLAHRLLGGGLQADDVVEIEFTVAGEGEVARRKVQRFTAYRSSTPLVSLARAEDDRLIEAEPMRETAPIVDAVVSVGSSGRGPTIYEGIYRVGLGEGMSEALIGKLVRAFAFEVDLTQPIGPQDRLQVIFSSPEAEAQAASGELLFASLAVAGLEHRVYRFRDPANDTVRHYDERGLSTSRLLLRKPIGGGVFRSGFGMRSHPILKRRRMHNGVDWAARRGTPIYAAGDATVVRAGWQSGYGRAVRLRLRNGYEAFYAHMSRIGDGVEAGTQIRQGDIVGYVGTSGLSTGNHLHYEVIVNARRVDPLGIRIPRDSELNGATLAAFAQERQRIDAIVDTAHQDLRRNAT